MVCKERRFLNIVDEICDGRSSRSWGSSKLVLLGKESEGVGDGEREVSRGGREDGICHR